MNASRPRGTTIALFYFLKQVGPLSTAWGHLATVHFKTSLREFAASTGAVHITFFGTRATSETLFLQVPRLPNPCNDEATPKMQTSHHSRAMPSLHLCTRQEGFVAGALDSRDVQLSREIGRLERVKLQTNSSDGWLLASMWIDTGPMT